MIHFINLSFVFHFLNTMMTHNIEGAPLHSCSDAKARLFEMGEVSQAPTAPRVPSASEDGEET